jgi:hypothetical protein
MNSKLGLTAGGDLTAPVGRSNRPAHCWSKFWFLRVFNFYLSRIVSWTVIPYPFICVVVFGRKEPLAQNWQGRSNRPGEFCANCFGTLSLDVHSSQYCSWCLTHFCFTSCDPRTTTMPRGASSQKRKEWGSGDVGTSFGPSTHNLRPRG